MATVTIVPDPRAQRQYPDSRTSTNTGYAFSDTTLAESVPSSPRNQPPPYGFGDGGESAEPPRYQEETASIAKECSKKRIKKKLIIRLMTSILITVIVCLIVAAVVGRIHVSQSSQSQSTPINTTATATINSNADKDVHATRITMMEAQTSLHPTGLSTVPNPTFITRAAATAPSLTLLTGKDITTFDCPFVDKSKEIRKSTVKESSQQCQLKPLPTQSAMSRDGLVAVSMHNIDGCLIARGQYEQNEDVIFHCAVSCEAGTARGIEDVVPDGVFDCT